MSKSTALQRGLHKMIQNLLIIKSNTSLNDKTGMGAQQKPKALATKASTPPPTAGGKSALWKKLSLFVAFPVIAGVALLTYMNIKNQPKKERPPFIKYEYMRIRHKRFPWGEGDKSFFHNPHLNALSDGYEE